jgi:tetratricopeptide (TPR) repeat protein
MLLIIPGRHYPGILGGNHLKEDLMRTIFPFVIALLVVSAAAAVTGKTFEDYITEATGHGESGDLEQATAVIEKAIEEYPDSAVAYAYLGLYRGMQAGQADDFMEAGRLSPESLKMLDKAVTLDPDNTRARLYRGLMGVKVPEFMGRLDGAITDLEFVIEAYNQSPQTVPTALAVSAYNFLGEGYLNKGDEDKARHSWEKVVELVPDTPTAQAAAENIAEIAGGEPAGSQPSEGPEVEAKTVEDIREEIEADPGNAELLAQLGKAYIDTRNHTEAEKVLREATELDPSNANAYKWLGLAISMQVGDEIYDERIHEDTDWATSLVFETLGYLDKAVELAPEDTEARLIRGIMEINFPFFTGKFDQGMSDLEMVAQSDAPEEMKAQALYWLGFGYRKRGTTFWIDVIDKYPKHDVARMVFAGMHPGIKRLDRSKYPGPIVAVDFILGFRDELPPQTAVWIETEGGEFVRTLYVSGFSGYAREVQIVLPVWAATSDFADADAVTAASVDNGHHIYIWDLRDSAGREVGAGKYTVKVEAHYWPSMKYQLAAADIRVGEGKQSVVVEEGDFIPYLEVSYLP